MTLFITYTETSLNLEMINMYLKVMKNNYMIF